MWKAVELSDKSQIQTFLESDRLYAAYAIGDLEPALFARCAWAGAERAGRLGALALRYDGLEPPALFLMGETKGLRAIFEDRMRPDKVYFMCRLEHQPLTREFYGWEQAILMWRMVLDVARFAPRQGDSQQLTLEHRAQLKALYTLGGADAFTLEQLAFGVFYGVFVAGELVAAAGTHLVSSAYRVAAVGNIFTHPDHRGQGYGGLATSAVVSELLRRGIGDIVLNVGQENAVAVRLYERLGFVRYCPFLEGPAQALHE